MGVDANGNKHPEKKIQLPDGRNATRRGKAHGQKYCAQGKNYTGTDAIDERPRHWRKKRVKKLRPSPHGSNRTPPGWQHKKCQNNNERQGPQTSTRKTEQQLSSRSTIGVLSASSGKTSQNRDRIIRNEHVPIESSR